ncbi:MAG: response regulator [Anaerolineales bacterium]|nr:response regulator [Anaerolineales bacterium]
MTMNKKVLYIEDAFENRMLIRRILQAEGFTVLEAENARHAMEVLETETPDLILMDINMPDIDGYTLTTHLRTFPQLAQIPIIALTANVMRGDRERTLAAGCNGYIQKPIDVDTFPAEINQYLER